MDMKRIDFGCGKNKKEGFFGIDVIAFPGVDLVVDLKKPWPLHDNSVEEANCSHFLEHLTATERVFVANELYRVMVPDGKAMIVSPHWASCRAYGDPTHQWPPVSEFWFCYLSRLWRIGDGTPNNKPNAPHNDITLSPDGFNCDFDHGLGYNLHPSLTFRNDEYKMFATGNYKEAAMDIVVTLTAKKER